MEMQPGFTLWLTGMSGAGKSTLARYIASRLPLIGRRVELLDGPEVEALFPEEPRASAREQLEHSTRALGWAAKLLTRNGVIAIVTSLSPYRESREEVRKEIGRFVEVMVEAPWEKLLERDHRGFYKQGVSGAVTDIIGYHEPYQTNTDPEIKVDTGVTESVEELGREVFERLFNHGFLSRRERDVLINGGTLDRGHEEEEEEIDAEEARHEMIERRLRAEAAARAEAEKGAAPAKGKKAAPAKAKAAPAPKAAAPRTAAKVAAPARAKAKAAAKVAEPARAKPSAGAKAPAKAKPVAKVAAKAVAAKAKPAAARAKPAAKAPAKQKPAAKKAAPKQAAKLPAPKAAKPTAKAARVARPAKAASAKKSASRR